MSTNNIPRITLNYYRLLDDTQNSADTYKSRLRYNGRKYQY